MRLIVVEADATFGSLCEQLRAQPREQRVALLVQRGTGLPHAGLTLVLLRRLADVEKIQLGLVSDNHELRQQAAALGLPAFRDLAQAEGNVRQWAHIGRREQLGLAGREVVRPPFMGKP